MGTWIALALLAVMVGLAIFVSQKKGAAETEATPTAGTTNLFAPAEGTPSSIEVKPAEGDAVRIVRNEKNVWAMELPLETEADPGASEAAATQISALKIVSTVEGKPDIFGFDKPAYVITIGFAGGKQHTLEIGDKTPTDSGYYVRIDKDQMVIADLNGIESLLNLQAFPPYLNTPTPTPSPVPPTETPTATQSPTATPETTATSTP